jgi:hypothetical protein
VCREFPKRDSWEDILVWAGLPQRLCVQLPPDERKGNLPYPYAYLLRADAVRHGLWPASESPQAKQQSEPQRSSPATQPGEPAIADRTPSPTSAAGLGDQAGAANPLQPPQAQRQPSPQAVTSKELPSLDKRLNDPAVGIQASARVQSTSAIQSETPHPGGRPPVVNWEMVDEEVFRLMNDNGEFSVDDPEWNAQARLEEAIGDFCENKFEKRPSETAETTFANL